MQRAPPDREAGRANPPNFQGCNVGEAPAPLPHAEARSPRLCASADSVPILTKSSQGHQEEDGAEPLLLQGDDLFPEKEEVLALAVPKGRALHRGIFSYKLRSSNLQGSQGVSWRRAPPASPLLTLTHWHPHLRVRTRHTLYSQGGIACAEASLEGEHGHCQAVSNAEDEPWATKPEESLPEDPSRGCPSGRVPDPCGAVGAGPVHSLPVGQGHGQGYALEGGGAGCTLGAGLGGPGRIPLQAGP